MAQQISREQLKVMFRNFQKEVAFTGHTFASVKYFTDHAHSRVKDGKKVLQKMTETRITIGTEYAKKVNKILEKKQGETPDFVAEKMTGKFRPYGYDVPIVAAEKNPTFEMLCAIVENHVTPTSILFHEGAIISHEKAVEKQLFTPAYFNQKATTGRGRVEEEYDFHFITLGFDKIMEMTVGGETYKITE